MSESRRIRISARAVWCLAPVFFFTTLQVGLGADSKADSPPNMSGKWQLNREQSESSRDKINYTPGGRDASSGRRTGDTVTTGGSHRGAVNNGTGAPREAQQAQSGHVETVLAGAEALDIIQSAWVLDITEFSGGKVTRNRMLFTDGSTAEVETESGKTLTKAVWKGGRLIVEEKSKRGGKIIETYELAAGGRQLYVTVVVEDKRFPKPLSIRRVYDTRADDESPEVHPKF